MAVFGAATTAAAAAVAATAATAPAAAAAAFPATAAAAATAATAATAECCVSSRVAALHIAPYTQRLGAGDQLCGTQTRLQRVPSPIRVRIRIQIRNRNRIRNAFRIAGEKPTEAEN